MDVSHPEMSRIWIGLACSAGADCHDPGGVNCMAIPTLRSGIRSLLKQIVAKKLLQHMKLESREGSTNKSLVMRKLRAVLWGRNIS